MTILLPGANALERFGVTPNDAWYGVVLTIKPSRIPVVLCFLARVVIMCGMNDLTEGKRPVMLIS